MSRLKTHYGDTENGVTIVACGRQARQVSKTFRYVDCQACQNTDEYLNAYVAFKAAEEKAFQAQEPRTIVPQFGRVNDQGVMECFKCGGTLFRERPRSLFSYHYVCANEDCGQSMHPLTETGMCT